MAAPSDRAHKIKAGYFHLIASETSEIGIIALVASSQAAVPAKQGEPQGVNPVNKALTLLIGFIGDFSWPAHQEISQSQYFFPLHCRLILPKEEAAEVAQAGLAVLELLAGRGEWQEEQRAA